MKLNTKSLDRGKDKCLDNNGVLCEVDVEDMKNINQTKMYLITMSIEAYIRFILLKGSTSDSVRYLKTKVISQYMYNDQSLILSA